MVKRTVDKLTQSLAGSPILVLILTIFLVESYIMVNKLDALNTTLIEMHKDSVCLQKYIIEEAEDTKAFVVRIEGVEQKLEVMLQILRNK